MRVCGSAPLVYLPSLRAGHHISFGWTNIANASSCGNDGRDTFDSVVYFFVDRGWLGHLKLSKRYGLARRGSPNWSWYRTHPYLRYLPTSVLINQSINQ